MGRPIIDLHPGDHVFGFYFESIEGADLLAVVLRREDGRHYAAGRTRVHLDDKTFGSDDKKFPFERTWSEGDVTDDEAVAEFKSFIVRLNEQAQTVSHLMGVPDRSFPLTYREVNGDMHAFHTEMETIAMTTDDVHISQLVIDPKEGAPDA